MRGIAAACTLPARLVGTPALRASSLAQTGGGPALRCRSCAPAVTAANSLALPFPHLQWIPSFNLYRGLYELSQVQLCWEVA